MLEEVVRAVSKRHPASRAGVLVAAVAGGAGAAVVAVRAARRAGRAGEASTGTPEASHIELPDGMPREIRAAIVEGIAIAESGGEIETVGSTPGWIRLRPSELAGQGGHAIGAGA